VSLHNFHVLRVPHNLSLIIKNLLTLVKCRSEEIRWEYFSNQVTLPPTDWTFDLSCTVLNSGQLVSSESDTFSSVMRLDRTG